MTTLSSTRRNTSVTHGLAMIAKTLQLIMVTPKPSCCRFNKIAGEVVDCVRQKNLALTPRYLNARVPQNPHCSAKHVLGKPRVLTLKENACDAHRATLLAVHAQLAAAAAP